MDSARFRRATVDNSGRSSVNIFVPDTESQIHAQPHEPESSSQRVYGSNYSGASFLNTTSIEEFVSKYQVIKVSWRGKYERILALAPTRFCTIDPKDFEVTNTWSLTALLSVHLDASDPDGFVLTMKGPKKDEQLKLRCRFRSRLLLDLYRLKQYQQRDVRPGASFQCHKWSRKGTTFSCTLTVWMDCVTVEQLGVVRSKYIYTEMEYLALLTDSQDGLAFGYTGRDKLIFSQQREKVFRCIQAAADAIGCKIPAKADLTAEKVQESRAVYGLNVGEPFVQFHVKKITQKYSEPRQRIISLHEKYFVELDWDGKVIACYKYLDIYMLVRETKTVNQFEIQFCNEQVRTYLTDDRDGILTAFYDICATCEENPELFISCILNQRGLRMLPFFAVEGVTETQQFFNGSSIGNWYLQRMGSVGKLKNYLDGGDRGFVEIVAEFNANVPVSGIPYYTKSPLIADALRPMCAQLYYVAKTTPVPERAAITILQALFRISSSYYGFREIGQAGQISKTIANLLINGKEFVVFWTTLLLRRMTTHTPPTSISET
ncbi:hypothetical protein PsorP6_004663 [Peronosclerospora sorghi]|uniref:Uncharacterized protein n=1 Tax=Peronosclerospora sorghi TaxID=230839 RepID=A0ACC0VNF9_9STRA|nr:hypothetical protein PsorP6_004663 [Peronosclerospora sorghi]